MQKSQQVYVQSVLIVVENLPVHLDRRARDRWQLAHRRAVRLGAVWQTYLAAFDRLFLKTSEV
jgi:hypothetical protein